MPHIAKSYSKVFDANQIYSTPVQDIYGNIKNANIIVIGECTTYRAVINTDKAELCFDINEYNGITDYEIEYEQTCDHDGITEFNKILSQVGLTYFRNCPSKIKRTLDTK